MVSINGDSSEDNVAAVVGNHTGKGNGVIGRSVGWQGVLGTSVDQAGTVGVSDNFIGVWGESHGEGYPGVVGVSDKWAGVVGESRQSHPGVWGKGSSWQGVLGSSVEQAGVVGTSEKFVGVWGESRGDGYAGVNAICKGNGPGVYGEGSPAGHFKGDVVVTGDLVLQGADYAESLTVADIEVEPGMVVVLDDEGRVRPCTEAYDRRVAGIASGAGGVRSALVLDRHAGGVPVALMGKLWVLADAADGAIRPGDRLTSSATPGHARLVLDGDRAPGAVIGKALTALAEGTGLVRVLVCAS
jgi:hypothetical protein